jgi:exonuclease VII large subunit
MLGSALQKSLYNRFRGWEDLLAISGEKLDALSPYSVLKRGYGVLRKTSSDGSPTVSATDAARVQPGAVIRRAADVEVGDELNVLLGDGELDVRVLRRETQPRSRDKTVGD